MLLTIDIGNTNLTLGLYRGEERVAAWRLATVHERMPDEYGLQLLGLLEHAGCAPGDIDGIILASVVPPLTGDAGPGVRHVPGPPAAGRGCGREDRGPDSVRGCKGSRGRPRGGCRRRSEDVWRAGVRG